MTPLRRQIALLEQEIQRLKAENAAYRDALVAVTHPQPQRPVSGNTVAVLSEFASELEACAVAVRASADSVRARPQVTALPTMVPVEGDYE